MAAPSVTEEGELLEALQTKGATDPHYRVLCAHLASEFASWVEFLAGNDLPSPVHIPTDTAETFAQALVPLLRKEGKPSLNGLTATQNNHTTHTTVVVQARTSWWSDLASMAMRRCRHSRRRQTSSVHSSRNLSRRQADYPTCLTRVV